MNNEQTTGDKVASALTKQEQPLMLLLKSKVVKERFVETVGPSGGAWITAIINAANLNPKIWDCDPVSVVTAGLNAAVLRLSVDPSTSQAAIVPFGKGERAKAVFIPMVRGLKQLALRTDKYRWINDGPVYEGQEVVTDQMSGLFSIEGLPTSKTIIGYFAAFELYTGYRANIYMTVAEILEHGKRYSPSYNRRAKSFYPGSMWLDDFDKMARKTVLRLLLLRDGILDDGSRQILDDLDKNHEPTDFEVELADMVEGEIVDEPDPNAGKSQEQLLRECGFLLND